MSEITFGVRIPNSGPLTGVDNLVKAARATEDLGFHTVWVHDHVVWSGEMHRHHISSGSAEALGDTQTADFYESMTTLAFLAAQTQRVKLGVACLVLPCRNPIYAAKQAATLDHLTGGRLLLGVGLGSKATASSNEFEVFGVPYARRGRVTDEYIDAMKAIWTQSLASYQGSEVSFTDAEIFPKPLQQPLPVWVGGWTDYAAARAGRRGEGWIPGWLSPDEMAHGVTVVRRTAEEAGRDPEQITVAVEKLTSIARTRDEALERALPTIRTSSHTYERDVDDISFALDRHIIGSVDDVRRRVDEFVEAGVRHFELKLIYPTMDVLMAQMELWAEEIIPQFR